ncbi:MAG: 30S ribosome-binding factor RbfA [Planctomycetaceae bacterium]|nr:30S ribosome-binding factor RbfA [Planctomycetaceae bacterium]
MSTRRTAKVAEAIREVVSSTILFELRDPRVQHVTILHVEVPSDLRTAKVYVSVMGTDSEQQLCLHGLNSSRGFLQRKIADKLDLRYTPVLTFVLDDGIKKSIEASRILRELAEQGEFASDGDAASPVESGEPAVEDVETDD